MYTDITAREIAFRHVYDNFSLGNVSEPVYITLLKLINRRRRRSREQLRARYNGASVPLCAIYYYCVIICYVVQMTDLVICVIRSRVSCTVYKWCV